MKKNLFFLQRPSLLSKNRKIYVYKKEKFSLAVQYFNLDPNNKVLKKLGINRCY